MSAELVQLGSFYTEPGFVLVARINDRPVGCVALRDHGGGLGEVRRLFVTPDGRSAGLGRALMAGLVGQARSNGFGRLVLNTLPTMTHASGLYADLGFAVIEPYVAEATPGVLFYGRDL
jgi:putative acetyltransferase